MPCNTIQISSVVFDLDKIDMDIFSKTVEKMGFQRVSATAWQSYESADTIQFEKKTGKFRYNSYSKSESEIATRTTEIKKGYGKQVAREVAAKYGWSIDEDGDKAVLRKKQY